LLTVIFCALQFNTTSVLPPANRASGVSAPPHHIVLFAVVQQDVSIAGKTRKLYLNKFVLVGSFSRRFYRVFNFSCQVTPCDKTVQSLRALISQMALRMIRAKYHGLYRTTSCCI